MSGQVIQGYFVGGMPRAAAVQARPGPGVPAPGRTAVRAAQPNGGSGSFQVDPVKLGLARGGGAALPQTVLARMESALGADFSAVRVHVGPQAARIGAIAFTMGNEIYFAPGRYQPDSIPGRQLLGHELAHVVQQRQGRVRAPGAGISVVQDRALEAEADRLGQWAATHRAPVQAKMAGPGAPPPAASPATRSRVRLPGRASGVTLVRKAAAPARHRGPAPARRGGGRIQRAVAAATLKTPAGGVITNLKTVSGGNKGPLCAIFGKEHICPSKGHHAEETIVGLIGQDQKGSTKGPRRTEYAFDMNAWPCAEQCDKLLAKAAEIYRVQITVNVDGDNGGYAKDYGLPYKSTGTITYG